MQCTGFQMSVATLIVAVSVGLSACQDTAAPAPSAAAGAGTVAKGAPSGTYETRLADGTAIRLNFRGGGAVDISMTEEGETNSQDGKWVQNGEVFLVEGGEGLTLQLSWRGDALVTDFGGLTTTFTKT
jgi:hypothetical protein